MIPVLWTRFARASINLANDGKIGLSYRGTQKDSMQSFAFRNKTVSVRIKCEITKDLHFPQYLHKLLSFGSP